MYFIQYNNKKDINKIDYRNDLLYSLVLYVKKQEEIVFINLVLTIDLNTNQWVIIDKLEFFTSLKDKEEIFDIQGMDEFYRQVAGMKRYYNIPDTNVIFNPLDYLYIYSGLTDKVINETKNKIYIYPLNVLSIFFIEYLELKRNINNLNIIIGKNANNSFFQIDFIDGDIDNGKPVYTLQKQKNKILFGQIIEVDKINMEINFISLIETPLKGFTKEDMDLFIKLILEKTKNRGYIYDYTGKKKKININSVSLYFNDLKGKQK